MVISRWILLRMRTVYRKKFVEKIETHILCSTTFFRKSFRIWDNVEEDSQCRNKVISRCVRATLLLWKSSGCYTVWVCVFVALGTQHAKRMRLNVICDQPRSTIFFHIFSLTTWISKKKRKLPNTKCLFWLSLQLLSKIFLILRRNERNVIKKNVYWPSRKILVILVWF